MAADTAAKRFSAMNIGSPWRGLNVIPEPVMPFGERYAVMFLYSGIQALTPIPAFFPDLELTLILNRSLDSSLILNRTADFILDITNE